MSYYEHDTLEFGYRAKTFKSYAIGFITSLILTLLAFAIVSFKWYDSKTSYIMISLLAVTQLFVQSLCFLRLNATPSGRWNLLPFLFVLMIVTFVAGGSLWIMYNLNYNMG